MNDTLSLSDAATGEVENAETITVPKALSLPTTSFLTGTVHN
jgi:hypothetical protein